ncbi:MAG TPA: hypothetical protein PKL85_05085, partial [Bacteroidia bacterium]|nr:hypothetical protein [Bacteroidia bacterium]
GESTTLMDVLGNKTAVNMSKGEAQAQRTSNNKPVVQLTNDTKTILGYDCKKAVVTFKGESGDLTSDVWYTNELMARNSFVNEIDGIDGFMLEFTTEQNGMAIKMVAKTIQEVPVEDTQFVTPEGYTQMTQEQVKQLYTGGK